MMGKTDELSLLQLEYDTLKQKCEAYEQQIEEFHQRESIVEYYEQLEQQYEQQLAIAEQESKSSVEELQQQLHALQARYDELEHQLTSAKAERKALDEEREQLVEAAEAIEEDREQLEEEREAFEQMKEAFSLSDAMEMKRKLDRLQQNYDRVLAFSKDLQQKLTEHEQARDYIAELEAKQTSYEQEVKRLDDIVRTYRQAEIDWARLQEQKEAYDFLKQQHDTLSALYDKQQMELAQVRDELLQALHDAERVTAAENKSAFYEIRLRSLQAELQRLQKKEQDAIADESRMFESFQLLIEQSAKTAPSIATYPGDAVAYQRILQAAEQGSYEFSPAMVQGFLAAMRSTRFIILKGLSGTGKTSLPKIVAHALGGVCEVIAVQPNWKSKTDLIGFYNHFNDRFMATQFTENLLKAQLPENKDKFYFIVLDEMNLARVEYYFSDFNSKLELEESKQFVELFDTVGRTSGALSDYVMDGNKLRIPPNVFFIGTINEDDSTYTLSDKIYDRAQVLDFQAAISEKVGDISKIEAMPAVSFTGFKAQQQNVQKQSVAKMFRTIDDVLNVLSERLYIEIGNRPRRHMQAFLQTYAANKWSEQQAIDLQIVSKIVPKIMPSYDEEFEQAMDDIIRIVQANDPASQAARAIEKVKRHAK